jgi:hypothetical protein
VRVTLRHRFDFGDTKRVVGADLVQPSAWDAVRETAGPFGLPAERSEWEQTAAQPELARRAADIVAVVRSCSARSLCSHGVGTGLLELNIHRAAPSLDLACTDYAPRTTERLRRLFPEARVIAHDLGSGEPPPADLHLMHRIDTELDTSTWMRVFPRFSTPILLVPVLLLGLERMVKELGLRLLRPGATRAGWVRTEDALRALWAPTHDDEAVTIGGQRSFLLRRRPGRDAHL